MEALDKHQFTVSKENCIYQAHHAVLKLENVTKKYRAVFN